MSDLLNYVLYALVFIAMVLAVEGGWLLLRSLLGREDAVNKRIERARRRRLQPRTSGVQALAERYAPSLAARLRRAGSPVSPLAALAAGVGGAVLLAAAGTAAGAPVLLITLAALVVGLGLPLAIVSIATRRRRAKFLDQLPQAVDLIARSLQAGHPVTSAMSVVGKQMPDPIGPEFGVVIEEMTYGLDRDQALQNLVDRFPVAELRMFVASLEVTRESGGNLAEVFIKLAEGIRAKAMLRKKVEAVSAEGRLSFWVVSGLPVAVVGMLMLLRPAYYTEVSGDPLFWPMMAMAPVLLAIGATIIWRMVNFKI